MNARFSPEALREAWPHVVEGFALTLQVVIAGTCIALVLGLGWALSQRVGGRVVRALSRWLVLFVRNTPLLVQVYFLHYFLVPALHIEAPALWTGIAAIGLHYSTYTSEVYRAGIDNVPRAQWEAAAALSLGRLQTYRHVILPQAIAPMLPALGNYVIAMFKDAPLLSAIAVAEVLSRALEYGSVSFRYVEALTLVGLSYMAVSLAASAALTAAERRLSLRQGGVHG